MLSQKRVENRPNDSKELSGLKKVGQHTLCISYHCTIYLCATLKRFSSDNSQSASPSNEDP